MLKLLKKGLRISIILAIVLTMLPQRMLSTQGANTEKQMNRVSFKDDIGYYVYDGDVFAYNKIDNSTNKLALPIENVISLAYDGTSLYFISEDMSVHAYDLNRKTLVWINESLKDENLNLGSAIFLDKGILHINTFTDDETTIFQLQARDGTTLCTSKGAYRNIEGSMPYVSGEQVVFSSKDIAFSSQGQAKYVKLNDETFRTSVYDATSNQIFAIGDDNALYVTSRKENSTYLTLYKTNQSFVGKQTKATIVEDTPVIFMLEEQHVVLYFYDGVKFVKETTGISTSSIASIAFDRGELYVIDDENTIHSTKYTLPTKQTLNTQSAQLQTDILAFYDTISQKIDNVTLEHKTAIIALYNRYQALIPAQQAQILASAILMDLVVKTETSQKVVDDLNTQIASLASPEQFTKDDRQKALDIQVAYLKLKAYDKTLIDEKLLRILDKIQAFLVADEIADLPTFASIAITDLSRIQEIAQHYDALKQEWKKDVHNYSTLQRLENRVYELMSANTLGDAYWSNFGGNKTSSATTNTKTPLSQEDVQSNFKAEGSYQESIIVDDHIYTIRNKQFLTILDNKGNLIAETKLYSSIGFFSRLAYGDGKIYVALNDRIQAFDAKTLRPLWLSQKGNQFISTITYHNGYIYSGMTTGGGGDKGKTNGYFFAIKVKDEDVNNAYEEKDFTWTCGEAKNTGYYWAGAAIVGDAVIFAGDSGEVISHHVTQDIMLDQYYLGDSKVRANVSYIEAEKAILVGTQDTHTLFKIKINENGSFQKDTIQSVDVNGEITGGIGYYNGRAYVPSGGMYAKGFSVVDTETMKVAYRNTEVGSQSYPLISTAYASTDNNEEVNVYVLDYKTGNVHMLRDAQGQTVSKVETLSKGYGTYNSGSITPDAYGNLYICGASFSGGGPLYSIQSKHSRFSIAEMEQAIANFSSNFTYYDKVTLQALLKTYQTLSESEQKQVHNADVLLGYEQQMQNLTQEKLQHIQQIINTLSDTISIQHQVVIASALKEYGELLESDQLRISNYEKLVLANEQLQVLLQGVEQLQKDIDAISLDSIRLTDQVTINMLSSRYEKLSEQERTYITNYDKLLQAKRILKRLADELELPNLNAQVENIIKIDMLTLKDEKQVMSLYNSMMMLDEEVREQIVGYGDFLDAYQNIIEQRSLVDALNQAIWNDIQPLNIQLRDKERIIDIYNRYTNLSVQNQAYVQYVEDLQYAKIVVDKMDKGFIAQELFEKIKMANTTYTFASTTTDGLFLEYRFVGKDIQKADDFAYTLSSSSIDEGAIRNISKDAKILSFAHNGNFPGKASIKVDTQLEDGTYHLYYYHPIKKNAELVQDIEIVDGFTSFTLTHASTYFISKTSIDPWKTTLTLSTKDVKTGDHHSTSYGWFTIVLSLAVLGILRKKA